MGVKKSTVLHQRRIFVEQIHACIVAGFKNHTSTLGSVCRGNCRKTESSVPGLSFAAQPAALAIDVSFTRSVIEPPVLRAVWHASTIIERMRKVCAVCVAAGCELRFVFADVVTLFSVLAVLFDDALDNALGLLVDFCVSERRSAVAGTRAHAAFYMALVGSFWPRSACNCTLRQFYFSGCWR